MKLNEFINISKECLIKEREADINENKQIIENSSLKDLQQKGLCILKLKIEKKYVGLFGRIVIKLEHLKEMPTHSFSNGDIVSLTASNESISVTGVISKVTSSSISIAFDDELDSLDLDDALIYRCTKMTNDVTYKRINKVLSFLEEIDNILLDIAFGDIRFPDSNNQDCQDLNLFNTSLDNSQIAAVNFCLNQKEIAIVHGPPGTGKTTTIIEVINQLVEGGLKVLVCSPSNIAVDNLVERLVVTKIVHKKKPNLIRLGHPARLLPSIINYSLDSKISNSDDSDIVKDVRADISANLASLKSCCNKYDRAKVKAELRHLKKELKSRQEKMVRDILRSSSIVLGTLTSVSVDGPLGLLLGEGSFSTKLNAMGRQFDVVVIDECSQALEMACWIGLLWGKKCVLAGDHHQLPPTIITHGPEKKTLEITLMERLISKFGDKVVQMLTTQYRMHDDIMRWSSVKLYNGRLIASDTVKSHLLVHLENIVETEETLSPLLLIDTAGCLLYETGPDDRSSKGNEGEAFIVESHVKILVESGLRQEDIAIIVPYNLQAEIIRLKILKSFPRVETRTVDGFQGREKEAVILSFVRSNSEGQVGFLADYRRINVAVTRARRHLCVICDTSTVCRDDFIKSLINHITSRGNVRSAHEYINDFNSVSKVKSESKKSINKKSDIEVDDHQKRWNYFDKLLREFKQDRNKFIHSFSPSLNSHDRLLVHQISDLYDLKHESLGEGADRRIVVSKSNDVAPNNRNSVATADADKNARISIDQISAGQRSKSSASDEEVALYDAQLRAAPGETDANNSPHTGSREDSAPRPAAADDLDRISLRDDATNGCDAPTTSNNDVRSINNRPIVREIDKSRESARVGFDGVRVGESESKAPPPSGSEGDGRLSVVVEWHSTSGGNTSKIGGVASTTLNGGKSGFSATDMLDARDFRKCELCGAEIPRGNLQLHYLHCRSKEQKSILTAEVKISSNKNVKATNKNLNKKAAISIDGDDFDSLIESAINDNKKCHFLNCKRVTSTIGQICHFCKKQFCLSHSLPEVHGCGEAAKLASRHRISVDGAIHPGSGAPFKHSDVAKRQQLKKKLSKKLGQMEDGRKPKMKDGGGKK